MIQQKICDIGNRAFQCYLVFINTILREGGVEGGGGELRDFLKKNRTWRCPLEDGVHRKGSVPPISQETMANCKNLFVLAMKKKAALEPK